MTTYHTSDWHFGHENIIRFCDRPFGSLAQMAMTILSNTNDLVKRSDRLIIHGDNVMGDYATNMHLLSRIQAGRVIFIPGNHDRWSLAHRAKADHREAEALRLKELHPGAVVLKDRKPSSWDHKIGEHDVLLSHYPYEGDHTEKDRHKDMRPVDKGLPLIHGHVHTKWRENGRQLNVGVDVWDFAPVSEHAIETWIETSSGIVVG